MQILTNFSILANLNQDGKNHYLLKSKGIYEKTNKQTNKQKKPKTSSNLEYYAFPRKMIDQRRPLDTVELDAVHSLTDESLQGYGVVMHDIHLIYEFKEVFVNLVPAKSRVEILKELNIAKLELLDNLLLNRSMYQVMSKIKCSMLNWIKQNQKL